MNKTKTKARRSIFGLAMMMAGVLSSGPALVMAAIDAPASPTETTTAVSASEADLQAQIDANRKRLEEIHQQSASYQQLVDHAAGEVKDIQSQVALVDAQLAQTAFSIQEKQEEINTYQMEIDAIQKQIDEKTQAMNEQKDHLANAMKQLDAQSRVSTFALVLTKGTLSEYYSQTQAVASISQSLEKSVGSLRRLKADLQSKQDDVTKAKDELQTSKLQLEVQQQSTQEQKDLKTQLLSVTKESSAQYQDMLAQAQREEQQANATISAIEKQLAAKRGGDTTSQDPVFSSNGFIWPLRGTLTALYRDPTYPFRCSNWKNSACMDHTGLDIGVQQGTPVRATADGVVSVVSAQGFYFNNAGQKTRSALNFVGIIHGNGLSTRYLHLTTIYVKPDQIVRQGDIIGLSGGLPGTAGAGGMTTGAHLHFEVRVEGIPDDPLKYLPK